METTLREAHEIAMSITADWGRFQNVSERELKAAHLLFTLEDEIKRLKEEVERLST